MDSLFTRRRRSRCIVPRRKCAFSLCTDFKLLVCPTELRNGGIRYSRRAALSDAASEHQRKTQLLRNRFAEIAGRASCSMGRSFAM